MIRMLEGMLVVSISQQLLNMAKVSLHSKVKLVYHLPIHVYVWCIVFTDIHMGTSCDVFIYCFCWSRLSSDGRRTFLVNLDSDTLKPEDWDKLANEKPDILSFSDISIYELHIRDFRCKLNLLCLLLYGDQQIIDFLILVSIVHGTLKWEVWPPRVFTFKLTSGACFFYIYIVF